MKQAAKAAAKGKEKTNKELNLRLAAHVCKELQKLWKGDGGDAKGDNGKWDAVTKLALKVSENSTKLRFLMTLTNILRITELRTTRSGSFRRASTQR